MTTPEEKRKFPRSAYESRVLFELSAVDAGELMPVVREGRGVDISEDGLGLLTDYPLKKDEVVKLHFPPDPSRTELPAFARVAWSKSIQERFRVGMQFLA
jgi:hypothetical protein